ncbi:MAG: cobyrinate a,c-diamide synthase [Chlorobium sp.]|uniref:cobyrinate a,c-diamide synthase n=1 Tax=Chlorobium sp. TaxID=1095 RepID=UPI002F41FD78
MTSTHTAFLLAAPSSGSGKTTLALALMRILAKRGLRVQPFKCGPDYLDTRLHGLAASCCGRQSNGINLDTFMASERHTRELFARHGRNADVSAVEGVMGLFDGAEKAEGSSAEIAKLLDLPVIMVLNAKSMAYSAAPLLYGFRTFDPDLRLAGVIFNQVGTSSHYSYLEAAAKDAGVEPLGYVPRNQRISISERHLGLNTSPDYDRDAIIEAMAEHVAKTVCIDRLLEIARTVLPEIDAPQLSAPESAGSRRRIIAVARDEAFNFLYDENLTVLQEHGEVVFFSPMEDRSLPRADLLYLAGGYPELHAEKLAANRDMREAVTAYCMRGGAAWAECGGLMYLAKTFTTADGTAHPMCGVFDLDTSMQDARLSLGYRKVRFDGGYPMELRGHEFHYSRIVRQGLLQNAASVRNTRNEPVGTALFRTGNTFASYVHLYWGERRDFPAFLMAALQA